MGHCRNVVFCEKLNKENIIIYQTYSWSAYLHIDSFSSILWHCNFSLCHISTKTVKMGYKCIYDWNVRQFTNWHLKQTNITLEIEFFILLKRMSYPLQYLDWIHLSWDISMSMPLKWGEKYLLICMTIYTMIHM